MFFFYTIIGDYMKIYLDIIFLLNFMFDIILLSAVSIILRRNIDFKHLLFGGIIGSLSIFLLFIPLNSLTLFLLKIIISMIMVLITFGYRDFKYTLRNLFYLYTSSMILGGFLYFLNIQFSYKQEGLIFYHNGFSINVIVLILLSPLIIYAYIKQGLQLKNNYSNYYEVDLYFKDGSVKKLNGFLDTGNNLVDPYKKRPIILVDERDIKFNYDEYTSLLVPYDTLNNHGLLKCIIVDKIDIIGVGIKKNVLIGISKEKIRIDGINCILHSKLLEG
jgi:stage II sporulation protein GA (sporulation sigma-E factor processing peptidase)